MKERPLFTVDEASGIPLFGLDFLGIIDRGTNVLEIKPITICNLRCRYCFVSAGDYERNFILDEIYLIKSIKQAIEAKQCSDIEIHIAPYGEFLLYSPWQIFLQDLRQIPQIKIISIQTNGLLLTPEKVEILAKAGVTRLNISLNSLDPNQCAELCGVRAFPVDHLLRMCDLVLQSSMELLIAPIWFLGENNAGIEDIIKYVKAKEAQGFGWPKLRLGIQNYISYKTGRKIRRVHAIDYKFFFTRLLEYEKLFQVKLKLGPLDFGMHTATPFSPNIKMGDIVPVELLMPGRWQNEFIGRINSQWAVKVLTKKPLQAGQQIMVEIIRNALTGNLLTGEVREN
jgi:uncharacterized Fe-S cluster-containing radical SAM superfamily enzyme